MKFKNSLIKTKANLILTGIFSLTLNACSSGGAAAPAGGGGGTGGGGAGSPQIVGSVDLPDDGSGLAISGNYAYVAASGSGLQVIDVSNRATPSIVAELSSISTNGGVQFMDFGTTQTVSMAGGIKGVHQVNVTTPTLPVSLGTANTPGNTLDVSKFSNSMACTADGPTGVQIYYGGGLNNTVAVPEYTYGISISGNYCFATGGTTILGGAAALYVIDVSDPAAASLVQTLPLTGSPSGITIAGDYAYVAAGDPGMYVIDISTPITPFITGQTGALPATGPIAVDATRMRAYLGTVDTAGFPEDGLKIIDISNAGSPAVIATADLPGQTGGVFALDGFVYATTSAVFGTTATSKFHILDVSAF